MPKFHFEMPVYASAYVSRENFSACQTWLFGLSRAQQALKKNIAAIETFEGEIKAAFEHIEREIETLKGEYRAAIAGLKQTVAGMVEVAIEETTAQAFMSEPQCSCPLSSWIWWGANPANTGDLLLYRFSVNAGNREAIGQLISVEVERLGTFLPELPLHLVSTQKAALQISSPLCSLSILPRIEALDPLDYCPTYGHNRISGNGNSCFSSELANQRLIPASGPQFSPEKRTNPLDVFLISSSPFPQHPDLDKLQSYRVKTHMAFPTIHRGRTVNERKVTVSEGGERGKKAARMKTASGNLAPTGEIWVDLELKTEEEHIKGPRENAAQKSACRLVSDEQVRDNERVPRTALGTVAKRTSCVVCQAHYTPEDNHYFCPGACRCHRCVIEGIYDEMSTCTYCRKVFSVNVSSLVSRRGKRRCHVCGIVVGYEELQASALCAICSRCVLIGPEVLSQKAKGRCRLHQEDTFDIDKDYYTDLQRRMKLELWACCPRATSDDRRLGCGHYVCAVHREHLEFCRTCQTPVNFQ